MALSQAELQMKANMKAAGKSGLDITRAIAKKRSGGNVLNPQSESPQREVHKQSFMQDAFGDVKGAFTGIGKELLKSGEKIVEIDERKDLGDFDKVLGVTSEAFRGGSRAFGEGALGLGKAVLTENAEKNIATGAQDVFGRVAGSETVQDLMEKYNTLDPEQKRRVDNITGFGEGLADIFTFKAASGVLRPLLKAGNDAIQEVKAAGAQALKDGVKVSTPTKPPVAKDLTPTAKALKEAEEAAPDLSFTEKFAGLTEDVKGRLQIAGTPKVQEYIDVVKARNLSDVAPTPYAYGAVKVDDVVTQLKDILNETGSGIGQTRTKLATIKAPVASVKTVQQTLLKQLDDLNLEVANGVVKQKAGTIPRVDSPGDVKILNDLYQSYRTFSASPTLLNMIDLRNAFDSRINFAKRAAEVSSSVDDVSRQVRKSLANEAATLVGKEGATDLVKYSEFMDALTELQGYTNRRAGGEYLLRVAGSGRGREAQQIIKTVKELTGTDLMNDATLMVLVTDMMGNSQTKTLFSQQVTQSGIDAAKVLSGQPSGLVGILGRFAKQNLLDEEKLLLEASKSQGLPQQIRSGTSAP